MGGVNSTHAAKGFTEEQSVQSVMLMKDFIVRCLINFRRHGRKVPKKVFSWRSTTRMLGFSPTFFTFIPAKLCIKLYTSKNFCEKLQPFFARHFLMGRFAI